MKTFDRYKQNLKQYENKIYSYDTHVATLHYGANMKKDKDALIQHGWWSVTTQKHINYVAREYNLPIIEMDEGKYAAGHLNISA
jgi:hypothetical protein|tara:strand:+ start:195 stop:446 length:252 start_codon:yes stop_codon:yes gene_type:complete